MPRNVVPVKLAFPFRGLIENLNHGTPLPEFTLDARNVLPYDTLKERLRGGKRPGTARAIAEAVHADGTPIQRMGQVTLNSDQAIDFAFFDDPFAEVGSGGGGSGFGGGWLRPEPDYNTVANWPQSDPLKSDPHAATFHGANEILNGEDTAIDFGTVEESEAALTETFVVHNQGVEETLALSNLALPTGYSLSGSFPSTIAPGETDSFVVQLDTATVGVKSGDVTFETDAPNAPLFRFAITGEVEAAPEISAVVNAAVDSFAASSEGARGHDDAGNEVVAFSIGTGTARAITVDPDGNIYVGIDDATNRIVKFDSEAATVWSTNVSVDPRSIAVDGDRNVYVGGATAGSVSLAKYSAAGVFQWSKMLSVSNNAEAVRGVAYDDATDRLFVALNSFESTRLRSYDTGGTQVDSTANPSQGDASCIAVDANAVYVGHESSADNFKVSKFSKDLATLTWVAELAFGDVGSTTGEAPESVTVDGSGNVIIAIGAGFNGEDGMRIIKLNSSGTFQWTDLVHATDLSGSATRIMRVAADTSGNIYIAGVSADGDPAVRKYSSAGSVLWSKNRLLGGFGSAYVLDADPGRIGAFPGSWP